MTANSNEKHSISTTADDDDKSVKSLGMLADVADEASRNDKTELLRDSSVETTIIQNSGNDKEEEENSPTNNNNTAAAATSNNNNRSILKHTRDHSDPPPTRIALKRQRSAPNNYMKDRPPIMVSRQRSTGSRLSFSDKVQICSSEASSSQQNNTTNLNKPAMVNRQHSMESLKLPSFIRTCDRQFSLESIMSFRSQESNFPCSSSGKLTPVMANQTGRSETPTSVDTPNTAKMEEFYQDYMGNNTNNNGNNNVENNSDETNKNDKHAFRPPVKKQKVSDTEKATKTTKVPSVDAKVKPPPLGGEGLRGWLNGSGSSQSNSIPFPASSNSFPPSFSSYNNNGGGSTAPSFPPTYPSKPSFVGYNTSTASQQHHGYHQSNSGMVRNVTTDQAPGSPRRSPPSSSSGLKFGHPRPEVVEGQQIYSRHTLLLWGAHKSDISPISGNIQEGCDSILIHSNGSSKQPNIPQDKDEMRFAHATCSLRNGGETLFASYHRGRQQYPIRVFTKSQGAGGIVGYRYDGLYSIMCILDGTTGLPKSDVTNCSGTVRVLLERNPSSGTSYPNRMSLDELWNFVNPSAAASSQQQSPSYPPAKSSPPLYPAKPPRMTTPSHSAQGPYSHYQQQQSSSPPRPQYNHYGGGYAPGSNPSNQQQQQHLPNKGNLRRQKSAEVSMIHIQYFDEPTHRPPPAPYY